MADCTVRLTGYVGGSDTFIIRAVREKDGFTTFWRVSGDDIAVCDIEVDPVSIKCWRQVPIKAVSPIARANIRAMMQPDDNCSCGLCKLTTPQSV